MSDVHQIKIPDANGNLVSYPVKDLTETLTRRNITNDLANLPAAIAEQDLKKYGYKIGDFFIGPTEQADKSHYEYILADLNHFKGGDGYSTITYAVIPQNHIAIIVNTKQNVQWNTTAVTDTGYAGSNLHSYLENTALPIIKSDIASLFGDWSSHLVANSKLFRTTNNKWGWAWSNDKYISAPTSVQFHGAAICDMDGTDTGEGNKPLEVFQKYRYNEILGNRNIWLRSISSAGYPCHAGYSGHAAGSASATASSGAVGLIIFI